MRYAILVLLLSFLGACPPKMPPDAPEKVAAIIDCSTADARATITADVADQKAKLLAGTTNWTDVYARSKSYVMTQSKEIGVKIGGCIIAELVQWVLGQRGGPIASSAEASWEPYNTLKTFREREAGGATFETVIDGRRVRL